MREAALAAGARAAVVTDHFQRGGAGAEDLARAVWEAAQSDGHEFRFLSRDDATPRGAHRAHRDPRLRRRRRRLHR